MGRKQRRNARTRIVIPRHKAENGELVFLYSGIIRNNTFIAQRRDENTR